MDTTVGENEDKFNVNVARALAKRTLNDGKNYAYPLKGVAEHIGFDVNEEYVNDDGQVKTRTIILPAEVRNQMRHEFPAIGFKRVDGIGGGNDIVVYRKV